MMFFERSCSPKVMKIFWPLMRQVPSAAGVAFDLISPRSEPACGSVRFMVPVHLPLTSLGRYFFFCASVP